MSVRNENLKRLNDLKREWHHGVWMWSNGYELGRSHDEAVEWGWWWLHGSRNNRKIQKVISFGLSKWMKINKGKW